MGPPKRASEPHSTRYTCSFRLPRAAVACSYFTSSG
ncbi:hypothetical protein CPT_Sciku_053 [Escherichia phage Sciku]|nr:hypothetical protein CPT_Shashou_056 [Escherichia phage Shashou]QEG06926.1 hypothetical protein CPT_Sciku_053 [Escherichia phage Sciku]QEG07002.1 hypothetical protein CPT_Snoke_056 [Escherichia phage Snoke]